MRRAWRISGALAAGITIVAACTFPSPELRDDLVLDASPSDDVLAADTSSPSEAGAPDASNPDVLAPPDADRIDGDAAITAPDGQVVNCDEDNDRFAKVGGVCGGFDCDDSNGNVRPDRDFNTLTPIPGTGPGKGGDWNCNGTVEYELKVGVDERCPLLGLACEAGFVNAQPTCGSMARFVVCEKNGLGCRKASDTLRAVGCR